MFISSFSSFRFRHQQDGAEPVSSLRTSERNVLRVCTEVLFPSGGAIPISGTDAGVVGYVDRTVGRLPTITRLAIRGMFHFIEYSPWVVGPFKKRLTRLDLPDRRHVLKSLMNSRIYLLRTAFLGLRTLLTIGYFGNHDVNRSVGSLPSSVLSESTATPTAVSA